MKNLWHRLTKDQKWLLMVWATFIASWSFGIFVLSRLGMDFDKTFWPAGIFALLMTVLVGGSGIGW